MTRPPASIRRARRALPAGPLLAALTALAVPAAVACATPTTHVAVEATVAARPQASVTPHAAHPTPAPLPPPPVRQPLEVVRLTDYLFGGSWYIVGEVRNTTEFPRRYAYVSVTFLDEQRNVLAAHLAYASGPEVLAPGATAPFALAAPPDPRVRSYRLDARGLIIPTPTPPAASGTRAP